MSMNKPRTLSVIVYCQQKEIWVCLLDSCYTGMFPVLISEAGGWTL